MNNLNIYSPIGDGTPRGQGAIQTSQDYYESLKGRQLKVYLFGELVEEPSEHPMIRPSVNAVAETYDLALT